jgi:hypothetical protein
MLVSSTGENRAANANKHEFLGVNGSSSGDRIMKLYSQGELLT